VLSTSPRQATYFRLERGYPFAVNLEFTKSDDSAVDLSGASIFFDMDQPDHLGGANIITARPAVLEDPATLGRAFFSLQGEDLDIAPGEYPFAFTILAAGGYGTVVIKGTAEIIGNANDVPLADFTNGGAPFELGVKMLAQNRIVVKTNHLPDKLLQALTADAETASSAAGISAEQAATSAAAAAASAAAAEDSVIDLSEVADQAAASATSAATSADAAAASATSAATSASDAEAFNTSADAAAASATAADASADAAAASAATWVDRRTYWLNEADDLPTTDLTVGDIAFQLNHTTGFVTVSICQVDVPATWNTIGAYRFVPTNPIEGKVLGVDGDEKPVWVDAGVQSTEILVIDKLTQAEYDAIVTPDPETLYVIVD
jgi:hypothetical protein